MKSLGDILENDNWTKSIFKQKDILYNEFKSKPDKPIEYTTDEPLILNDIGHNITGRLYPSKADILYNGVISHQRKMKDQIINYTKELNQPKFDDYLSEREKVYKDPSKIKEIWNQKQSK